MQTDQKPFDLAVIGGGITGAGIARDATLRGLSVVLIEKNQFGSGTSSKSSKLIHGGIRYLEQFEFKLVKEALQERGLLLQLAPHLVRPLAFALPVYRGAKNGTWKIRAGLWLYDRLAGKNQIAPHRALSTDELRKSFPALRTDSLRGAFQYWDAQTDDLALVNALIESAQRFDTNAIEETELLGFENANGKIIAAKVKNLKSGETFLLRSKLFINAAGPWVDSICKLDDAQSSPKLRLTKGAHLLFASKKIQAGTGLLLLTPQDKRVFFVLPWKGQTLVGTTDTDFQGSPDQVRAETADLDYLLEATRFYFPTLNLKHSDILDSFAGLRPLLRQEKGSASQVSREHQIFESRSGLITIAGGKLTSYRRMAEELVDLTVEKLRLLEPQKQIGPCRTKELVLH